MAHDHQHAESCNQQLWDELAPVHARSYRSVAILRDGGSALDEIELEELGPVAGKTLLHLQCHIGTDTLSWVREGAIVTGVDFSQESLSCAHRLRDELGLEATFIHSNVYDLPQHLDERFDIVYTSRGVLCWLRDLEEWARIIAHFLAPGGVFYLMESHPILNIFDDDKPGDLTIRYPYFHRAEPAVWDDDGPDYSDPDYIPEHASHEWGWTVSDILNAIVRAGLQIEIVGEYERTFHRAFPDMVECRDGWYHFPDYVGKLPLLFTLRARKPE